eukprot:Skav202110  [mRNA]  locus=scaffold1980:95642:96418:+ [translate_table: standard]
MQSLSLMESMRLATQATNRVTCNSILDALERGSMWQYGAVICANLPLGIQPDVVTYATSISTYAQFDAWAQVSQIVQSMRCSHCTLNTVAFTSAICACRSEQQWPLAISLFLQLLSLKLQPNELSCSNLLTTTGAWWQSLWFQSWLHHGIDGLKLLPFNAAATSCAEQSQWQRCLHLRSGFTSDASDGWDVASANALAASVCHLCHSQLGIPLLGALQMATLETIGRQDQTSRKKMRRKQLCDGVMDEDMRLSRSRGI